MLITIARRGFTIVELLIVIVVIAILAGITVAVFNGITERSKVASIKSDLSANAVRINAYIADYGRYPIYWDIESAESRQRGYMIKASNSSYYNSYVYCTMGTGGVTNEVVLALRTPQARYYATSTAQREPRDITAAAAGTSGSGMCQHGSVIPGSSLYGAWVEGPAVN